MPEMDAGFEKAEETESLLARMVANRNCFEDVMEKMATKKVDITRIRTRSSALLEQGQENIGLRLESCGAPL